ncbi:GNAT family N-acetyltransferase [Zunongwangia sp. H14]|uniref:GNAT family N-acetyltransferase n=1 Tax=Zunongwangia sp. H14 TaxID=3240792 RepID=UPI00356434F3
MEARKKLDLTFREIDYSKDLTEVVALIQIALDPGFSVQHFKWKHLENPFGRSFGILALDGKKIVGLRMFMFWSFYSAYKKKRIRGIRPVDTVTHPEYRGHGIFKKLTLDGLEKCKENYDFVFNTPNEISFPIYSKLGWQKMEQVQDIKIALINPFNASCHYLDIKPEFLTEKEDFYPLDTLHTYTSLKYLKWRYKSNKYSIAYFPAQNIYIAYGTSSQYLVIYEILGNPKFAESKMLYTLARKKGKVLIYYYDNEILAKFHLPVTIKRKKPVIVMRNHEKLNASKGFKFSLADLEAVF